MQTIDARLASAILRLRSNTDFVAYQEWLSASLAQADESNRRLDGAALHRSQGKALALEELLKAPNTAEQALTRANARS